MRKIEDMVELLRPELAKKSIKRSTQIRKVDTIEQCDASWEIGESIPLFPCTLADRSLHKPNVELAASSSRIVCANVAHQVRIAAIFRLLSPAHLSLRVNCCQG